METKLLRNRLADYKYLFIEVVCYAYIILFLYASAYKLFDYGLFVRQLESSPLIGAYRYQVAWLVPLCEIGISALLLFGRTRLLGLYAASGLMLIFTMYIAYILLFAPHVPCSCGGILATMGWGDHLVLNSGFVMLGITAAYLLRKKVQP